MKKEALKLADELAFHQGELSMWTRNEACRMIRRLVEEFDKLNGCLIAEQEHNEMLQTKPLSDEEIKEIAYKFIQRFEYEPCEIDEIGFVRAIEERHGIK